MTELVIVRGIPGSRKTTWAKAWVAESPETRLRVSRDDMREMLHGKRHGLTNKQELAITETQMAIVKAALAKGVDVVVDGTNLRARNVKDWMRLTPNVVFQNFPVPLEQAIADDATREHSVGEKVVRMFWDKYTRKGALPPAPEPPPPLTVDRPYKPDDTLPTAYLADIDNTLALIPEGGRSPYDGTRVHEDILNVPVARLVNYLEHEHHIVVMSGRDSKYRDATVRWLVDNNVHFDELFMRPEGDTRRDDIVKRELFDTHVRDVYCVLGAVDDRLRVCRMWHALGVPLFRVGDPDADL